MTQSIYKRERIQKMSFYSFSEIVIYLPKSSFECNEKFIKFGFIVVDADRRKALKYLYQMDLAV